MQMRANDASGELFGKRIGAGNFSPPKHARKEVGDHVYWGARVEEGHARKWRTRHDSNV